MRAAELCQQWKEARPAPIRPLLRPAAARRTAAAISGARLVLLPGVGHDLPAPVWPQVAGEGPGPGRPAAVRGGG